MSLPLTLNCKYINYDHKQTQLKLHVIYCDHGQKVKKYLTMIDDLKGMVDRMLCEKHWLQSKGPTMAIKHI